MRKKKLVGTGVVLFLAVMFFVGGNIFGIFLSNEGDCLLIPDCKEGGDSSGIGVTASELELYGGLKVKSLIREGGIYFFQAAKQIDFLTQEIERLQRFDKSLLGIVTNALENMEIAKEKYSEIRKISLVTPPNYQYVARYKAFDYVGFREKHNLNPFIFDKVSSFLVNGDINAYWADMHFGMQNIIEGLESTQAILEKEELPIWQLFSINNQLSETKLSGLYAAMVFLSCK